MEPDISQREADFYSMLLAGFDPRIPFICTPEEIESLHNMRPKEPQNEKVSQ